MHYWPVKNSLRILLILVGMLAPMVRGGDIQSLTSIAEVAEAHVRKQLADKPFTNLETSVNAIDSRLRLKPCETPLEPFGTTGSERSGRMTVGIRCNTGAAWTLYVPVQVRASIAVVSAIRALSNGSVLTTDDLVLVEKSVQELPANYLNDPAAATGMALTRSVPADTLLTQPMLKQPLLVNKGQEVVILADGTNFAVKMGGTALQNGSAGQRIGVKNRSSGRTVQGLIVDSGTVRVKL